MESLYIVGECVLRNSRRDLLSRVERVLNALEHFSSTCAPFEPDLDMNSELLPNFDQVDMELFLGTTVEKQEDNNVCDKVTTVEAECASRLSKLLDEANRVLTEFDRLQKIDP